MGISGHRIKPGKIRLLCPEIARLGGRSAGLMLAAGRFSQ
jgi:hypothetical protein